MRDTHRAWAPYAQAALAGASDAADAGQTEPAFDPVHPTGNDRIDSGLRCAKSGGDGCYLEADQRAALATSYEQRVLSAQTEYKDALLVEQMERLNVKEPDDLPWFASLILDVVGAYGLRQLTRALTSLTTIQVADLGRLVESSVPGSRFTRVATLAHEAMGKITPKGLEGVSKVIVDKGKDQVAARLKTGLTAPASDQKSVALGYLAQLKTEALHVFKLLREDAHKQATDAQLVVMWRGMDPDHHSEAIYRTEIAQKIQRYERSGVETVGRSFAVRDVTPEPAPAGNRDAPHGNHRELLSVVRDRIVVRVVYDSGAPPRYGFAHLDWRGTDPRLDDRHPIDPATNKGREILERLNAHPEIEELVPTEFESVAIERHRAVWGSEPRTIRRKEPPIDRTNANNYLPGAVLDPASPDRWDFRNYGTARPYQYAPDRWDARNYGEGKPFEAPPDRYNLNNYLPDGPLDPSRKAE